MGIDKQDLDEQIEHHQEMLRIERRNLRERERQAAKHGLEVQISVSNHIHELKENIRYHEAEIARLQTLAAEDKEPLAEVEYRAALSAAWEPGRPTVVGSVQLGLVRLRSGIKPERAEELEQEIRAKLTAETLTDLDLASSEMVLYQYEQVLRAFRLDHRTARRILAAEFHEEAIREFVKEADRRLWVDKTERTRFLRFLADLRVISAVNTAVTRTAEMLQGLGKLPVTIDDVASGLATAEKSLKDALHAFYYGREAEDNDAFPLEIIEAASGDVEQAYADASGFQSRFNNAAQVSPDYNEALSRASNSCNNAVQSIRYAYKLLQRSVSPALVLILTDCLRAASLAAINATNLMRKFQRSFRSGEDRPGAHDLPAAN